MAIDAGAGLESGMPNRTCRGVYESNWVTTRSLRMETASCSLVGHVRGPLPVEMSSAGVRLAK